MLEKFFKYFAENQTLTKLILFAIIILGTLSTFHIHRDRCQLPRSDKTLPLFIGHFFIQDSILLILLNTLLRRLPSHYAGAPLVSRF